MPLQPRLPYFTDQVKVKFYFTSPSYRWVLTIWHNSVGPSGLASAIADAIILGQQLFDITATDVNMPRIVASCANTKRATKRTAYFNDAVPPANLNLHPENDSDDCIRVFVRGGNSYRSSLYLSGIPDEILNNDAIVATGNAFYTPAMTRFQQLLVSGAWGSMQVNQSNPRVPILDIVLANPAVSTVPIITTALPHGLAINATGYVRVGGVPKTTPQLPLNQIWQCTATTATQLDIINFTGNITSAWILNGGGFAQYEVRVFDNFLAVDGTYAGTHSRGNRTLSSRARQKVNRHLGWTPS